MRPTIRRHSAFAGWKMSPGQSVDGMRCECQNDQDLQPPCHNVQETTAGMTATITLERFYFSYLCQVPPVFVLASIGSFAAGHAKHQSIEVSPISNMSGLRVAAIVNTMQSGSKIKILLVLEDKVPPDASTSKLNWVSKSVLSNFFDP